MDSDNETIVLAYRASGLLEIAAEMLAVGSTAGPIHVHAAMRQLSLARRAVNDLLAAYEARAKSRVASAERLST